MKIFYQKEMPCPICGKKILNSGKTNDSGLYEEERFHCWRCKEDFLPYQDVQKMFLAEKYAIDIKKDSDGWNYRVLDLHGKTLKEGTDQEASCAMSLCRQVIRECNLKNNQIRALSEESRILMLEIFERGGRLVPAS